MNIRLLLSLFLAPLILAACGPAPDESATKQPATPAQHASRLDRLTLDFSAPVFIDSTDYVMYPLVLDAAEEGSSLSSDSYSGRGRTYWNVAFYNTRTGAHHLLNDQQKMVIQAYHQQEADNTSSGTGAASGPGRRSPANGFLYYDVTTLDFNRDGKLDGNDHTYLFVSDKTGRRFHQISPPNAHVENWSVDGATGRVLLLVRTDTNQDRAITNEDETTPLVYDLRAGREATAVFGKEFTTRAKQQLDAQWPRKP